MLKTYYSCTTITHIDNVFGGFGLTSAVLLLNDTLVGNGVNYMMLSTVIGDNMTTEVNVLPYSKAERYKIFQGRNLYNTKLPFKVRKGNIKECSFKNESYIKEL